MQKNKNLAIKVFCMLVLVLTFTFGLYGCTKTKTHNIITNEITNKVVKYEDLNILDFENAIQTATERVENAVVGVVLKAVTNINSDTSEDDLAYGSGVVYKAVPNKENDKIVSYTYYVVTNRHIIEPDEKTYVGKTSVYVYLGYIDVEVKARIAGYDPKVDLACLTFESTAYIQPVEFGDSSALKKGSIVLAIGNPEGFDYYGSVTWGIISSPLRYISSDTNKDGVDDFYGKYIQHDASINPGNSGGGLFTLDGKLVGINTMKFVSSDIDNMGFALTSNEVKHLLETYLEEGLSIERPRLGVTAIPIRTLTPAIINANNLKKIPDIYNDGNTYGLYVTAISLGGSCDGTGISVDDIILEFNGVKIKTSSDVSTMLSSSFVGSEVEIKYYSRSDNNIRTTTIILNSHE